MSQYHTLLLKLTTLFALSKNRSSRSISATVATLKPITLALQLYVKFLTYEWEDRSFTFSKQISILKVIINRIEQSLALLQELFFRLVRGTEFRPSSCQFLRPRMSQATEDRARRMKVVHLEQVLPIDTLVWQVNTCHSCIRTFIKRTKYVILSIRAWKSSINKISRNTQ